MMGKLIMVTKTFKGFSDNLMSQAKAEPIVEIETLKEPRVGWCVGFRYIPCRELKVVGEDWGYSRGFRPTKGRKAFPVMLVSFWPTERSVMVPLDESYGAFRCYPTITEKVLYPSSWGKTLADRKRNRAFRREVVQHADRDEKGRFKK